MGKNNILNLETVTQLENDLNSFYDNIDRDFQEMSTAIRNELSKYKNDPADPRWKKWVDTQFNPAKSKFKHVCSYWYNFTNMYPFNFAKIVKNWNGIYISTITKTRKLITNHSSTSDTIKNLVKFQVLAFKDMSGTFYKEMTAIIAINTIQAYCNISSVKPEWVNTTSVLAMFWNSIRIKNLIDTVMKEISEEDHRIYNDKGKLIWPPETPVKPKLDIIGMLDHDLTEEYMLSVIGDTTDYNTAVKMILKENPFKKRHKIYYALKKTGLDKRLEKRSYTKTSERWSEKPLLGQNNLEEFENSAYMPQLNKGVKVNTKGMFKK